MCEKKGMYQIIATVETFEIQDKGKIHLTLKGAGKHIFELEDKTPEKYYNILEPINGSTNEPIAIRGSEDIYFVAENSIVVGMLLSQAFIGNKRLKFNVEKGTPYTITSISKAD